MKNTIKAAFVAAALLVASSSYAQVVKDVKEAGKDVGQATAKTAKKVGNKTAEVASKGKSAVVDKKYSGKVGPQGQTIYIDKNAYYYYVNKKGRHIYVKEADLVAKVD